MIPREVFMSKQEKRAWRFIKNFRNIEQILLKKHEEIMYKKEVEYEVILKKRDKRKETNLIATILDKNKTEGIMIENEYWPSEAKIATTALAILIAISKEKAKVRIYTNSKIISNVFNELEERKESKSTTKEDLGQLKYAVRHMMEIKETRIEIVHDKKLWREVELPRMRTEVDTYNFDAKSCYALYDKNS